MRVIIGSSGIHERSSSSTRFRVLSESISQRAVLLLAFVFVLFVIIFLSTLCLYIVIIADEPQLITDGTLLWFLDTTYKGYLCIRIYKTARTNLTFSYSVKFIICIIY